MNPSASKYKILIVDDEWLQTDFLKRYLERHLHVSVDESHNGQEAIEKTRFIRPHLILLDINAGRLVGWDVIKAIREFDCEVRFLVVTGFQRIPERHRPFIEEHAVAWLNKPCNLKDIKEQIFSILGPDAIKNGSE